MSDVIRRVEFQPGWDKRHRDPAKNYGVHGMELRFVMIAPKGAVQFVIGTDWIPGLTLRGRRRVDPPRARDLGYHWPTPRYPEQRDWGHHDCDLLPGGACYYDGSGLNAEPILPAFLADGDEAVWEALDNYYRELCDTENDWLADAIEAAS